MSTLWRYQQLERARELRELVSYVRVLHKKIVLLHATTEFESKLVLEWMDNTEDSAQKLELSVAIDDHINSNK